MKIARAALFPKLDFDAGYNYNRTKSPASVTSLNRSNGPYWGFSLSVDIFLTDWKTGGRSEMRNWIWKMPPFLIRKRNSR